MAQNTTSKTNQKISSYLMMIVLIVLVLSVISIILAVSVYSNGVSTPSQAATDDLTAGFLAVIGVVALTMSLITLRQSRKQAAEMKIESPKVMTTIECKKCNTKTVREFQRGDYVYKDLEVCPNAPTQNR